MKDIYVIEYLNKHLKVISTAIDNQALLEDILDDCHEEASIKIKKIKLIEKSEKSASDQDGGNK